jgi:hypothetical protein
MKNEEFVTKRPRGAQPEEEGRSSYTQGPSQEEEVPAKKKKQLRRRSSFTVHTQEAVTQVPANPMLANEE